MAGNVVSLTLTLTAPDAPTAQAYEADIRAAFAQAFPQFAQPDPDGTITRYLVDLVEQTTLSYKVAQAVTPIDAQRDQAITSATANVRASLAGLNISAVVTVS